MGKIILMGGTEERRLVLKAVQENIPCQAVHICDEQPDDVKIWLNEIESRGPGFEFWVMNQDGKVEGEQIDRCPYCGAELKQGAGDVAIVNDSPESGDDGTDSGDGTNEVPDSGDDTDESANDGTEQPPQSCDWKNASGDDEYPEKNSDDPRSDDVEGEPLSLRGPELRQIVDKADTVLNSLLTELHAKNQHDGEMTVKITFDDQSGEYLFDGAVSGKINYTVKPQKISGILVPLKFDADGRPVLPADREHQLSFDEVQQPSGTATVDGKTGIVEEYQEGGGSAISQTEQSETDESEDEEQ